MRGPHPRLVWLGAGALALCVVVGHQTVMFVNERRSLNAAIEELEKVRQKAEYAMPRRPRIEEDVRRIRADLRRLGSVMPTVTDPQAALDEISRLASAFGVTITAGAVRRGWRTPGPLSYYVSRTYEIARIRLAFTGSPEDLDRFRSEVIRTEVRPSCWWRSLVSSAGEESGVLMMVATRGWVHVPEPRRTRLWPFTNRLRSLRSEISERLRDLDSRREILDEVALLEDLKWRLQTTVDFVNAGRDKFPSPKASLSKVPPWQREPTWLVAE